MAPRRWPYGDVEGEDLPVRDRTYESFGQQGVALPTYGDEPELERGAARVDLGEPITEADADVPKVPSGPKGWQRRDDRIHDDVCTRLTDDGYVDASDIEVIVHQGEVTLSGGIADRAQRERAIRIAESVRGVIDVISRLRVSRPASEGSADISPKSEK
jgi:BON domain-containing protein